jgi:hypothetical protein
VPDLRGLFLRGYGSRTHTQNNGSKVGVRATTHSSGALGAIQGDAIRNIIGYFGTEIGIWDLEQAIPGVHGPSALQPYLHEGSDGGSMSWTVGGASSVFFDASYVVPSSNEDRPVNIAVRYLIRSLQ